MLLAHTTRDPDSEPDYLIMIHTAHADAALDVAYWLYRMMLEASEALLTHGSGVDAAQVKSK